MKLILTIVVALVAGFAGGILSVRIASIDDRQVIRARGFEVMDETGKQVSFWGVDGHKNAVLAFGSRGLSMEDTHHDALPGGLRNPDNQLTAFGLQATDSPILEMKGTDGKQRVVLLLSPYNKPMLTMRDEMEPRLSLGIQQSDTPGAADNNWSLIFAHGTARIGMATEKAGSKTYVRGFLFVNPDKAEYLTSQPK